MPRLKSCVCFYKRVRRSVRWIKRREWRGWKIERILGNNDAIDKHADAQLKTDDNEKEMDVKYAKFARMQQARIPLAAIQNSARIQGMDVDELNKVLGVTQDFDAKKASRRAVDEEEVMRDVVRILNDELGMVEDDLVRKMAHTVQKTSRFNNASNGNEMIVDNQTLYHALGAFKGVQFARNEYNSALLETGMNSELIHAKRHAFAEMARSIGMPIDIPVEGMEMFEGTRYLSSSAGGGLAFVPLLDGQHVGIADGYKRRGELYIWIVSSPDDNNGHSYAYMAYEKGSFFAKHGSGSNSTKPSAALATVGRIIIDFDAAIENGHFLSIGRDDMIDGIRLKLKEHKTNQQVLAQKKDDAVGASDMILFSQIPDEYCYLTWPTVAGFSLTSKSWETSLLTD
ncbi:hypothetical protein ACHAXN_010887 [Cyclotella atomus]